MLILLLTFGKLIFDYVISNAKYDDGIKKQNLIYISLILVR